MAGVTLVGYGLGNIQAFATIYQRLNIPVSIAKTPEQLEGAEKIILPGVGAFDWTMTKLNDSGMRPMLDTMVLERKVPVMGVCVGMQIMAQRSEEGALPGLGWIEGEVVHFSKNSEENKPLPHMGWNDVVPLKCDTIFRNVADPRYYFLHSYCMAPKHSSDILATSDYGVEFAAAVGKGHIYGTQFHPEKSHQWGIDLLRSFAEL
jgi:glutamine amidotransferase